MSELLDVRAVARILSCHRSSIWRWIRDEGFPKPLKLSRQARRWSRLEVESWLEGRVQS